VTTTGTTRDGGAPRRPAGATGTPAAGTAPAPATATATGTVPAAGTLTYADVHDSDEFRNLRRNFRRFVFPTTVIFLAWYFLYVCLAAWAPDFMGTSVVGDINIGLLFGLGQFVSTFAITMLYVRWADRRLDASADRLRHAIEGGDLHTGGGHGTAGAPADDAGATTTVGGAPTGAAGSAADAEGSEAR
jgi:uncharacterized membrane protein (DUF485 family)